MHNMKVLERAQTQLELLSFFVIYFITSLRKDCRRFNYQTELLKPILYSIYCYNVISNTISSIYSIYSETTQSLRSYFSKIKDILVVSNLVCCPSVQCNERSAVSRFYRN